MRCSPVQADGVRKLGLQLASAAGRVSMYAKAGYMVRVRSDYDTEEARASDPSRAQALLAAGAHFTSTDFPSPPTLFNSSYEARPPPVTPQARS